MPDYPTRYLAAVDIELRAIIAQIRADTHPQLAAMLSYHLGLDPEQVNTGKRVRALFTLLACSAAGSDWEAAIPAATSVELIHNFSLIHDDIQDQSELRRGRPTVWKRWGVAQGVNAGDALFALAQIAILRSFELDLSARSVLQAIGTLNQACLDLTRGQYLDLQFESEEIVTRESYLQMVGGKTAALFGAACKIGAEIARAPSPVVSSLEAFGTNLGIAFQVADDYLGIWGVTETTGKPAGDDLLSRKKTLPVICALEDSPDFQAEWAKEEVDIPSMIQLLETTGAKEQLEATQHGYTHAAIAALQTQPLSQPACDELQDLAHSLLFREQ